MSDVIKKFVSPSLGVLLSLFVLVEANYPTLQPQSKLAVFAMLGLVLCFLNYPLIDRLKQFTILKVVDVALALTVVVCCGFIIVQTEPIFKSFWLNEESLGNRAGNYQPMDVRIGIVGLVLVLEAARRSIGWAVPVLSIAFIAYAFSTDAIVLNGRSLPVIGAYLPDIELPPPRMGAGEVAAATFLQSLGIFGIALDVMFKYVYLFVIFGAFLEVTGATQFIIDFSQRLFGKSPGGPAKVAVLGSGLMGSLSGSAVANAVTTGTFTIPMMRSAGFAPHIAGGITAAAASGGALVPPVMGAGAYMMLELIEPKVTFVQIMQAAILPAILYYFSIFMIVHFYSRRTHAESEPETAIPDKTLLQLILTFEGVVFFGALLSLIAFLFYVSPFRAVTLTLGVIIFLGLIHPRKRLTLTTAWNALVKSARNGVSLVSASACVGIIIGIVQVTGVTAHINAAIKDVVEQNLFMALFGIMICSIILGMGVPSAVCYLLMATLMGSMLGELGVIPLAAHLFIFYFGMMSMVTPPVALAAYASASIADAPIMRTGLAAFRFSLVGFTLPYMFVYRPALLLMDASGNTVAMSQSPDVLCALIAGSLGIVALAAALSGYLFARLPMLLRGLLLVAAGLSLFPSQWFPIPGLQFGASDMAGAAILVAVAIVNRRASADESSTSAAVES